MAGPLQYRKRQKAGGIARGGDSGARIADPGGEELVGREARRRARPGEDGRQRRYWERAKRERAAWPCHPCDRLALCSDRLQESVRHDTQPACTAPNKESTDDLRETLKQVGGQVLKDWSQTFPPRLTDPSDPAHIQGRLDGLAMVLAKLIHDRDSQIPEGETSITKVFFVLNRRPYALGLLLYPPSAMTGQAQAGVKHSLDRLIALAVESQGVDCAIK